MGAPTRFPNGLTNAGPADPMGQLPIPDPSKVCLFFDDFLRFNAADWVITTTEAGTGSATEALTAGDGGLLLITNDDADNDADFFQKVGASFLLEPGKKAFFKARFKVSDAVQTDLQLGLIIVDSTPLDATDGIYFVKNDDAATLDFVCRKDATTGSTSKTGVATLVNDTFMEVAFYYDGAGEVKAFVDNAPVGSLDASAAFLPDAVLTPSFGIVNGSAGAKTMTVDFIMAAKER